MPSYPANAATSFCFMLNLVAEPLPLGVLFASSRDASPDSLLGSFGGVIVLSVLVPVSLLILSARVGE